MQQNKFSQINNIPTLLIYLLLSYTMSLIYHGIRYRGTNKLIFTFIKQSN